jgi:hypothetical protein
MSSRSRKLAIIEKASPVPEIASEVREGLDNLADSVRTLAAVMASCAAGINTDTPGYQRQMAGVIFQDAQERFGDVLRKLDEKTQADLHKWLDGLCKSKR